MFFSRKSPFQIFHQLLFSRRLMIVNKRKSDSYQFEIFTKVLSQRLFTRARSRKNETNTKISQLTGLAYSLNKFTYFTIICLSWSNLPASTFYFALGLRFGHGLVCCWSSGFFILSLRHAEIIIVKVHFSTYPALGYTTHSLFLLHRAMPTTMVKTMAWNVHISRLVLNEL